MPSATKLLLNGDDLIASSIAPDNERKYFGIKSLDTDVTDCINLVNDLRICPRCSSLLKYTQRRYHHIGKAYCPTCGFKSPQCDYEGQNADLEQMTIEIAERDGSVFCYRLLNDSVFNIYNVVAIVGAFSRARLQAAKGLRSCCKRSRSSRAALTLRSWAIFASSSRCPRTEILWVPRALSITCPAGRATRS